MTGAPARVKHQSLTMEQVTDSRWITGCVGTSLCGLRVYDQLAASQNFATPVKVADLPLCRRCVRAAAARA